MHRLFPLSLNVHVLLSLFFIFSSGRPARVSAGLQLPCRAAIGFRVGDDVGEEAASSSGAGSGGMRKPTYGLSPKQMAALGAGGPVAFRDAPEEVQAEMIAARAAYRDSVLDWRIVQPLGFRGETGDGFKSALQTSMISGGTDGKASGQAPPDLPSLLLDARICYLGPPSTPP